MPVSGDPRETSFPPVRAEIGSDAVGGPLLRVIIPAKNEASRIARTVADFCEYFGERATIFVVANGCSDDTAAIVRALTVKYDNLQLLDVAAGIGKGGAIRAGLTMGREAFLGFVDADGSTRPDQLDVLLGHCREKGVGGAIGSRWLRESRISRPQPLRRRIASRAFNYLVRLLFGLPYSDTQCGAKVFEREAIDRVFHRLEIANFAFDVDLLVGLKKIGCPVDEIPIAWGDVPEYSKVMLLRSGSSMAAALVRLFVRDSILRHVPFADLLARSSIIPVKPGLQLLVISPGGALPPAAIALLDAFRCQGHRVDRVVLRTPLDALRFAVSYARRGHRRYDALIDLFGNDGSAIVRLSTKPKVHRSTLGALSADEMPAFVARLAERCGCHTVFRRVEDGWALSSSRIEALVQESV